MAESTESKQVTYHINHKELESFAHRRLARNGVPDDHATIVANCLVQADLRGVGSQLLASGSDYKTIKLWDPSTGALKHTISTGVAKDSKIADQPADAVQKALNLRLSAAGQYQG
ncbi:hypothetical protein BDW59DRAFT_156532 [Aspergillus cavernicola]|uniref:Uncharacterized protein n=1 Tax=Aspergillus cavernicola TaxID=176166 RepID=A0ABR4J133_9EURO